MLTCGDNHDARYEDEPVALPERRYSLTGRNFDRGITFTETVWARSAGEAVQRATTAAGDVVQTCASTLFNQRRA